MQKIIPALLLILLFANCQTEIEKFDANNPQEEVLTQAGIDSVLALFETVTYDELDEAYKDYSLSNGKFEPELKKETYYVLKGDDVLRYIVGEFRIRHFLTKDKYFGENNDDYSANKKQYWLTDKRMLYMLLDLILELDRRGHDKYAFEIRDSHRHPKYNAMSGGASKSQHVLGKAVDIVVQDINQDGEETEADKAIVLEIVEEIIGNSGGIGKYPWSMTIHFDSRGYRARWDSH